MLAVRFLRELRPMPDVAAAAMAQTARRELADAIQYRDFCRDTFEGFPSDDSAEIVREAEDDVDRAKQMLGEWEA